MTAPPPETVVYARHGATELALDIFRPHTDSRHCAVLIFHGGGWRGGAKEFVHAQAIALAAQGFTALAVQYRLLGVAAWPAQLDDAVAACAWTRDNADALDIDPTTLVVQGHSAGAQMALLTGALDADVRPAAIVVYYPAIGFHPSTLPDLPGDPDTPRLRCPWTSTNSFDVLFRPITDDRACDHFAVALRCAPGDAYWTVHRDTYPVIQGGAVTRREH
jgi:acetyl esterase/lipase